MFGNRKAVLEMPADSSASAGGGALGYAGFWARVAALLVDSAILTVFGFAVILGLSYALGETGGTIGMLIYIAAYLLYWPVMECSARQATFGKSLLGIQVTDLDGNRTSFIRALLRNLGKIISSMIFGIGYLLAAFTSRKQALHDIITSCLVVRAGPSHLWKAVLATVAGFILTVGAVYYYVTKIYFPQQRGKTTAEMENAMKGVQKDAPAKPPVAKAPGPDAKPAAPSALPASLSEADYDKLLARQLSGLEKPSSARAGPALLQLDTFFGDSMWLKVMLPPIPNLDHSRASITINRILDAKNQDRYDRDSAFEKEFFRNVSLSEIKTGVPHFAGNRSVRVKKGTTEPDVQKVEGVLHLSLPIELKVLSLGAADVGKEQAAGPAKFTLKSLQGQEVSYAVAGAGENFLGSRGFDAQGSVVPSESISHSGGDFTVKFRAPVARIEFAVASSLIKREYSFLVIRGATAPAATAKPGAPTPSAPVAVATPPAPKPPTQVAAVTPSAPPAAAPTPAPKAPATTPAKPAAAPAATAAVPAKPAAAPAGPAAAPAVKPKAAPKPTAEMAAAPSAEKPKPARRAEPRMPEELASFAPPRAPTPAPRYNDVMTAVMYRDRAAATELLELGWWADRPDSNGVTPLMAAAMNGDTAMVQLLLKHGANPNLSGPGGSMLSYANRGGDGNLVELLRKAGAR